ncbi:MAG: hypothetical protein R3E50_00630 [Halioglobus sp.]
MLPAPLTIFLLGCLHEDVAIIAASYFVVEHGESPWLAGAVAFAGMLVNNLVLYGVGALLRNQPWMQRWTGNERASAIRRRLQRHLVATLTVARFGHSMLMPALVSCGSLRIPLQRVLPVVALSAAAYLSILLALVVVMGEAVMRDLVNWAWVVPVAVATGMALWYAHRRLVRRNS